MGQEKVSKCRPLRYLCQTRNNVRNAIVAAAAAVAAAKGDALDAVTFGALWYVSGIAPVSERARVTLRTLTQNTRLHVIELHVLNVRFSDCIGQLI